MAGIEPPHEPFDPTRLSPRQVEILGHAVDLLREQGLAGLTVRRLADRIGFSEAALYRHFSDKQDLLVALVGRLAEQRLLGPMRKIAGDESRPVRERIEAIVELQLTNLVDLEGVPLLFLAEALATQDERLLARARWVIGSQGAIVSALLARLPREPDAPPPEALVLPLFGLGAGTALRFRLAAGPSEHPDLDSVLGLARYVLRRLLGDGEAPAAEAPATPNSPEEPKP